MDWLERHSDGFFKLNGALLIVILLLSILAVYLAAGLPNNSITSWTANQWDLIKFLWGPILINAIKYALLALLCFKKKYIVFPISVLFWASGLDTSFFNLDQIRQYGFSNSR